MQRCLASLMAWSRDNVTLVEIIRCTFDKSVKKGVCCKGCPELSQAHAAGVKRRLPLGSAQRLQLHHFAGASTLPGGGGDIWSKDDCKMWRGWGWGVYQRMILGRVSYHLLPLIRFIS